MRLKNAETEQTWRYLYLPLGQIISHKEARNPLLSIPLHLSIIFTLPI